MQIIKLSAIDSTNSYLKRLYQEKKLEDYTVVITEFQKKGRGQMGTNWQSEKGKNLTASVLKKDLHLNLDENFYVSMATSLAIYRALNHLGIPKIKVKWPNDILSEDKKICGILIENIVKKKKLEASVIGIGLNVNQTKFKGLPRASSLKLINGRHIPVDEVLKSILKFLKKEFRRIEEGDRYGIQQEYESLLYRINKPSSFKSKEGEIFAGFIKGVYETGEIKVLMEDEVLNSFGLKEIELMF